MHFHMQIEIRGQAFLLTRMRHGKMMSAARWLDRYPAKTGWTDMFILVHVKDGGRKI